VAKGETRTEKNIRTILVKEKSDMSHLRASPLGWVPAEGDGTLQLAQRKKDRDKRQSSSFSSGEAPSPQKRSLRWSAEKLMTRPRDGEDIPYMAAAELHNQRKGKPPLRRASTN